MVNKVILVGNVGKDVEVKTFDNGDKVASFSLATSESWKDKNSGEKKEKTEWHNIQMYRGLAGVAESYVKKGDKLYIEGKITYRSYEKDGATKYITEIVASEMKMLSGKSDSAQSTQSAPAPGGNPESDDLPF